MKKRMFRRAIAALVPCSATVLAYALKPEVRVTARGEPVNLETLVPAAFGNWRIDSSVISGSGQPRGARKT